MHGVNIYSSEPTPTRHKQLRLCLISWKMAAVEWTLANRRRIHDSLIAGTMPETSTTADTCRRVSLPRSSFARDCREPDLPLQDAAPAALRARRRSKQNLSALTPSVGSLSDGALRPAAGFTKQKQSAAQCESRCLCCLSKSFEFNDVVACARSISTCQHKCAMP